MIPRIFWKLLIKEVNKGAMTRAQALKIAKKMDAIGVKALDEPGILGKVGKKVGRKASNVVGRLSTKTKTLSPDVNLRNQQFFYNPHENKAGQVLFTDFKKTPMIDIDVAKGGMHFPGNVTHADRKTALEGLFRYLGSPGGQDDVFRVYKTKGGIRLFDVGRRMSPHDYYTSTYIPKGNLAKRLGGDKDYEKYNLSRKMFGSRISSKPGRTNDTIDFMGTHGGGQPIQLNVDEVKMFHDDLIKQIIKSSSKDEISLGGLFDLIGTI